MSKELMLKAFQGKKIRTQEHEETKEEFFCVIDALQMLRDDLDLQGARKYWKNLKGRLKKDEIQMVTNCYHFKVSAPDGKFRKTDFVNFETLMRLVPYVNSAKAKIFVDQFAIAFNEKVKKVIEDRPSPELRAQQKEIRKTFAAEIHERGAVRPYDHANITNIGYKGWYGKDAKGIRKDKGLPDKANVRNYLTRKQSMLAALQEEVAMDKIQAIDAHGYYQLADCAEKSANVTLQIRLLIEKETGQSVAPCLPENAYTKIEVHA